MPNSHHLYVTAEGEDHSSFIDLEVAKFFWYHLKSFYCHLMYLEALLAYCKETTDHPKLLATR